MARKSPRRRRGEAVGGDGHGVPAPADTRLWTIGIVLGIVLVTGMAYGNLSRNGFINFDDEVYLLKREWVHQGLGLEGVARAFRATEASNWQPLTWITHLLDFDLYGPDPRGHHRTSLLIHISSAIVLFLVLRKMSGALWRSALVGVLFAVHPLQVEPVAWVSQRNTVLGALFFFLTLGAWVRYTRMPGPSRYLLVVVLMAAGLAAKPTLITAPFMMLLLDIWPLRRLAPDPSPEKRRAGGMAAAIGPLLIEKIPFFLISLAGSLMAVQAQGRAVAPIVALPLGPRLSNAIHSYVSYLGLFLWPRDLAVFHPYPTRPQAAGATLAALALLAGMSALVIRMRRTKPWLMAGWLWYLGALVPVIGFVQIGSQAMADRYMYVPMVGLAIMAVWGVSEALEKRFPRPVLAALALCLVLALAGRTRAQVGLWRDSVTLFEHTLRVTRENFLAHRCLGDAFGAAGRTREAMAQYSEALRIHPAYADAHKGLGNLLMKDGRYADAGRHFESMARIRPGDAEARVALGAALAGQGRLDDAIAEYQRALRIDADDPLAHYNLADILFRRERLGEAEQAYRHAIRIDPGLYPVRYNLAVLLIRMKKHGEAEAQLREALRLAPELAPARYTLGNLLARQGRLAEALPEFEAAVRLRPDDREARLRVERVRAMLAAGAKTGAPAGGR